MTSKEAFGAEYHRIHGYYPDPNCIDDMSAFAWWKAGAEWQKQKDAEIASTFRCGTCGMDGKVSDAILNQGDE